MIGPSKPEHVREVYEDLAADRYVVLLTHSTGRPGEYRALQVEPVAPIGCSEASARIEWATGERIYWADLPPPVRRVIVAHLTEPNHVVA